MQAVKIWYAYGKSPLNPSMCHQGTKPTSDRLALVTLQGTDEMPPNSFRELEGQRKSVDVQFV